MLKATVIGGIASLVLAGTAFAQTGTTSGASGTMKMSSAECTTLWNKIDASKSGSVTQTQATPYLTDFKSADANNDGKLSSTEFTTACGKGMVHDTASTGAGSGTTGGTGPAKK